MGTRRYYVYRYRGIYFIYYSNSDSYPSGLGIEMLRSMRQPDAIARERQRFEELLCRISTSSTQIPHEELGCIPQKKRPHNDVWIEWVYEIDLDRNIFHIDGVPFFSLECLPSDESFLKYIGSQDHYNNPTCSQRCPPEQRYKRPAPPVVNDSELATYRSLDCSSTCVALSDLLDINDTLSPDERVRVSLLETMIGWCMIRKGARDARDWPDVGQMVCDIEIATDYRKITDTEWMTAWQT